MHRIILTTSCDHAELGAEYFLCVAYNLDRGSYIRTN